MYLNDDIQKRLRDKNVISENEVVTKEGDIFLAINVVTQQRRVLNVDIQSLITVESSVKRKNRKVLKG